MTSVRYNRQRDCKTHGGRIWVKMSWVRRVSSHLLCPCSAEE